MQPDVGGNFVHFLPRNGLIYLKIHWFLYRIDFIGPKLPNDVLTLMHYGNTFYQTVQFWTGLN